MNVSKYLKKIVNRVNNTTNQNSNTRFLLFLSYKSVNLGIGTQSGGLPCMLKIYTEKKDQQQQQKCSQNVDCVYVCTGSPRLNDILLLMLITVIMIRFA